MKKTKIVNFSVLSPIEKGWVEQSGQVVHYGAAIGIEKDPTEDQMVEVLSKEQPDVLIVNSAPVTARVIDVLNNIKLIICARGTPVNVDAKHCKHKNIPLTYTPGRNANGVAEYTIAMIITLLRKIPPAIAAVSNRECTLNLPVSEANTGKKDVVWMHPSLPYEPYYHFSGTEILGKTLGLVGFGLIGQRVAQKASALGMEIIAYDPYLPQELFSKNKALPVSLEELLKTADVISLHAKAGDSYLITEESFNLMRPQAVIINTARSALIDNDALIRALKQKKISGAVLDVFPYEPLSSFDPLLEPVEGLILTPHIAGATKEVPEHQSKMVVESLKAFLNEKPLPYLVK